MHIANISLNERCNPLCILVRHLRNIKQIYDLKKRQTEWTNVSADKKVLLNKKYRTPTCPR